MGCVDYKAMQCMCVFECLHICSYACMYVHVNTNKNNKNKQINKSDIGILMVLQVVVFYTFMGIFPFFWVMMCVYLCVEIIPPPSPHLSKGESVWQLICFCLVWNVSPSDNVFLYFLCSFFYSFCFWKFVTCQQEYGRFISCSLG